MNNQTSWRLCGSSCGCQQKLNSGNRTSAAFGRDELRLVLWMGDKARVKLGANERASRRLDQPDSRLVKATNFSQHSSHMRKVAARLQDSVASPGVAPA
jgi:hypothetical protein